MGKTGVYVNTVCTHTETEDNPWWYVKLGITLAVKQLRIWNRDSLQSRLNGFEVWVTDSADSVTAFMDNTLRCYMHPLGASTVTGTTTPLYGSCDLVG
eukprot:3667723-Rhodomonas_salina.1